MPWHLCMHPNCLICKTHLIMVTVMVRNKKKHHKTHAHGPHHHCRPRRRRSLVLFAQDLISIIKFLYSFSVAQFTLPGLLASQALPLACCPPSSAPASPRPSPPAPPTSSGAQSGRLKAPVLLKSSFVPN